MDNLCILTVCWVVDNLSEEEGGGGIRMDRRHEWKIYLFPSVYTIRTALQKDVQLLDT